MLNEEKSYIVLMSLKLEAFLLFNLLKIDATFSLQIIRKQKVKKNSLVFYSNKYYGRLFFKFNHYLVDFFEIMNFELINFSPSLTISEFISQHKVIFFLVAKSLTRDHFSHDLKHL